MRIQEFIFQSVRVKALVLVLLCLVLSQSSAQFTISKYSINNGAEVSEGINFQVTSSIGQKESTTTSSGAGYQLSSGFWTVGERSEVIFNNGFED
jgi:hypothetical protein